MLASPATVRRCDGEEVPSPSLPLEVKFRRYCPVEDARVKISEVPAVPCTVSLAAGVEVPIPSAPEEFQIPLLAK